MEGLSRWPSALCHTYAVACFWSRWRLAPLENQTSAKAAPRELTKAKAPKDNPRAAMEVKHRKELARLEHGD
jgi:hypothetical protein